MNSRHIGASALEASVSNLASHWVELIGFDRASGAIRHRTRRYWNAGSGLARDRFSFALADFGAVRAGDRFELAWTGSEAQQPCLSGLSWIAESIDEARVEGARGRSWRIALDHEVRDARLVDPGAGIAASLPHDAGGRELVVNFGIWGSAPEPWRFELELVEENRIRTLSTATVTAGDSRWQELRSTIPGHEGGMQRSIRLRAAPVRTNGSHSTAIPVVSSVRLRAPGSTQPNIILVSIDTLRADRMSLYGATRPTTPRLDAWAARRGVVFERAISSAPWTLPSHVSLFSGLDAHRHGVVYPEPVPLSIPMLAEQLRNVGYTTIAITGAGYLDPRYGLHRGFERYRYWGGAPGGPNEIRDGTERAIALFDEPRDGPLFLFFHTYEVHPPLRAHEPWFSRWSRFSGDRYVVPETWAGPGGRDGDFRFVSHPPRDPSRREVLPPELSALPYDLYDSGVASADEHVGRILGGLAARGLESESIVVVTSDHGEALGEHGLAGHGFLYDDNLRVPLVIAFPDGRGAGLRIGSQVGLVDLVPTLYDAVGISTPPGLDGISLGPLLEGASALAGRDVHSYSGSVGLAIRRGNRGKFLFWDGLAPDRERRDRYFHIDSDPGELEDALPRLANRTALEVEALRSLAESPGLRLVLRGGLAGTTRISGAPISADRVKWLSRPSPKVVLERERGVELEANTVGEHVFLVRSIGVPVGSVQFEFRPSDGPPAQVEIELSQLDLASEQPLRVIRIGDRLVVTDAEDPSRPAAWVGELWWRGSRDRAGSDPAAEDLALRDDLGALGYLQ